MTRIGFLGHVGNQNLGDEAIIAAVIEQLRAHLPDAEIVGFTMNPSDTTGRHGVPAYPLRRGGPRTKPHRTETPTTPSRLRRYLKQIPGVARLVRGLRLLASIPGHAISEASFLIRSFHRVRALDALLVTGSGQLNDFEGGPWGYPFTLSKWTWMARRAGVPVAFVSVGAGPIETRRGRAFLGSALRRAAYRSCRDTSSTSLIATLGLACGVRTAPDLAWSVTLPGESEGTAPPRIARIGINPLPFFAGFYWDHHEPETYARYVAALGTLTAQLIRDGRHVTLFPTQLAADPAVIEDIRAWMRANGAASEERRASVPPICTLDDLASAIRGVDLLVATRFHGTLLGLLLGRPAVMLAYHPKCYDLMAFAGLGEYVLDAAEAKPEDIRERLARLEGELPAAQKRIASATAEARRITIAQYGDVLRAVGLTP